MARPASMQQRQAVIDLADDDDAKLLRRALTGSRYCWAALAVQAKATAERRDRRTPSSERERHIARSVEYQRRADKVQRLIDQLPQE